MSQKNSQKTLIKIISYLLFVSILIFIISLKFKVEIFNFAGEKMFLTFHKNNIALQILENIPENKRNIKTNFLLGRIYFVENKLYKSVESYNKAIELCNAVATTTPTFFRTICAQIYYGRGLSYGYLGSIFLSDAEQDFKKYIEIAGQDDEYKSGENKYNNKNTKLKNNLRYGLWAGYNDLAWIYFLKGEFKNMENTSRDGLKISMSNAWLANMLGVSLLAQSKCNESKIYLENAKELINNTSSNKFGEAYTGDKPEFWETGKLQMQKTIDENIKLCENTFPQK